MAPSLSVDEAVTALWARKWRIVILTLAIVGLGLCYIAVVPRTFEASSDVLIHPGRAYQNQSSAELASASTHDRILRSQISVIESESVLRHALQRIGINRLYPELQLPGSGMMGRIESVIAAHLPDWALQFIQTRGETKFTHGSAIDDKAFLAAKRALRVDALANTHLIRISFRHPDPALAASVVNAIASSYIDRSVELSHNTRAGAFFAAQRKKYTDEFERVAGAFSAFASGQQMFSVADQRRLALERRSALTASLAMTRAAIAEKEAQAEATANQLRAIKPLAHVPQIGQLLADAAVGAKSASSRRPSGSDSGQTIAKDPPLLLVKVYQDTVQGLVRINSELAGQRAIEDRQKAELSSISDELARLAQNEAEFERLRYDVAQAREMVEAYQKKAALQQVDEDLSSQKMTNIQVSQSAAVPLEPVHPKPAMILGLSLIAGVLFAVCTVLLSTSPRGQRGVADDAPRYYSYADIDRVPSIAGRQRSMSRP